MAHAYLYCDSGFADWEIWQVAAKDAYFSYYVSQFPSAIIEMRMGYTDPISGITGPTEVKLATDGSTLHTDRLIDPYMYHPTDASQLLSLFNDDEVGNPFNEAYYCTAVWRSSYGGGAFTIIDQSQAEDLGFVFEADDP